jgi:hypothetical protein
MRFQKVPYEALNSRQRENFNFHKVAALLAEYGFTSIRLSDDWQGADFIAQHIDGDSFLRVQLKGRLTLDKKYLGKSLQIAFPYKSSWYLYPHDELVQYFLVSSNVSNTDSWMTSGLYSFNSISREILNHIEQYKL